MTATENQGEQARLAAQYPDWHLWPSNTGRAWATRRGIIAPPLESMYQRDPAWRMTIDADTWPELAIVLEQQTQLDAANTGRL